MSYTLKNGWVIADESWEISDCIRNFTLKIHAPSTFKSARHPQEAVNLAMADVPNRQEIGPRSETLHKNNNRDSRLCTNETFQVQVVCCPDWFPVRIRNRTKAYNSKSLSGRRREICHLSARSKPLHHKSILLEMTYKNVANPLYNFRKNQIRALRKVISKASPQSFATHCIIQPIKSSLKEQVFWITKLWKMASEQSGLSKLLELE